MKEIKKAVFPVAGFGTRFLPATKAMPKELLPIVNKPLIQYAVEEAVSAGIDTLIFVTGRNKRAIEDHFDANNELEAELRASGKHDQAEMVQHLLPEGVDCIFVRQAKQLGLGDAILCAERVVGCDPFAVLLADDFLTDYSPGVTHDLVQSYQKSGNSQLSYMEVDESEVSKYGIIVPEFNDNKISGIIEKPEKEKAPSNLASIGRYILTADIFDVLRDLPPGLGGEVQLADAINFLAKSGSVDGIKLNGNRFDCGSVEGYLNAIVYMAKFR